MNYKYHKYIFLESFVIVRSYKTNVLLYNLLNNKFLEIIDSIKISNLLKNVNSIENMYFFPLPKIIDDEITEFIRKLREKFMGDLFYITKNSVLPVQIKPTPKILSETISHQKRDLIGKKNILKYLRILSIYVNNKSEIYEKNITNLFKQYLINITEKEEEILDYTTIIEFLEESNNSSLRLVNILGGNILEYYELDKLIDYLSQRGITVKLHFLSNQIFNNIEYLKRLLAKTNIYLVVHITSNNTELIEEMKATLSEHSQNIELYFYINNWDKFDKIEYYFTKEEYKGFNYKINPILSNNIKYWKEEIFWSKEEILESKFEKKEIFSNNEINSIEFGKLIIKSNGEVYANINNKNIGNIYYENLKSCILNEINSGNSWFKIRKNVQPCSQCIFNLFCPPISNFEYIFRRNNLCNILKN